MREGDPDAIATETDRAVAEDNGQSEQTTADEKALVVHENARHVRGFAAWSGSGVLENEEFATNSSFTHRVASYDGERTEARLPSTTRRSHAELTDYLLEQWTFVECPPTCGGRPRDHQLHR